MVQSEGDCLNGGRLELDDVSAWEEEGSLLLVGVVRIPREVRERRAFFTLDTRKKIDGSPLGVRCLSYRELSSLLVEMYAADPPACGLSAERSFFS